MKCLSIRLAAAAGVAAMATIATPPVSNALVPAVKPGQVCRDFTIGNPGFFANLGACASFVARGGTLPRS